MAKLSEDLADAVSQIDLSELYAAARTRFSLDGDKLREAVNAYCQFLYLAAKHPNVALVPWTENLDLIWELHVLRPSLYVRACEILLGERLDRCAPPEYPTVEWERFRYGSCRATRVCFVTTFPSLLQRERRYAWINGPAPSCDSGEYARSCARPRRQLLANPSVPIPANSNVVVLDHYRQNKR